MSKRIHGNDHCNERDHHLYQIWDNEESEAFKYGISSEEINEEDGLSSRVRRQVNLFNRVVSYIRFVGEILLRGIKGRNDALDAENQKIEDFKAQKGYRPRGNPSMGEEI